MSKPSGSGDRRGDPLGAVDRPLWGVAAGGLIEGREARGFDHVAVWVAVAVVHGGRCGDKLVTMKSPGAPC